MRRYNPQEKKRMRYTRDHIRRGENDKSTRRSVRRAKARLTRKHRRAVTMQLHELTREANVDPFDTEALECVPPRRQRFWTYGTQRLDDYVATRLEARARRAGYNLLHRPLEGDAEAIEARVEALEAMFTSWTESTTVASARVARLVSAYLEPEPWLILGWELREHLGICCWNLERRAATLRAFLERRPGWRPRLEAWIEACARQAG